MGNQTRAFNVDGALAVSSIVGTGTAGITKNGSGSLFLGSPNDYAGPTLVHEGSLGVENNTALGASSGANAGHHG
jgi:fibronectin-binding autotransporter adhesin